MTDLAPRWASRYRNVHDADDAVDTLLAALDARHPVTVGFNEQRKELRPVKKRDGTVAMEWKPVAGQYVHTVRTLEIFDVDDSGPNVIFRALDRCPKDQEDWTKMTGPGIRTVRADRITDITVHVRSSYRLQNRYFIERVREHAESQHLTKITALTDDALWEIIQYATDRQDAENKATAYAAAR